MFMPGVFLFFRRDIAGLRMIIHPVRAFVFKRPSVRPLRAALALSLLAALILITPASLGAYGQPLYLTPAEHRDLEQAQGKVAGEVVFSSRRDGKWRLFRVNADGSNLSRLSLGPANYTDPEFIQNGRRLIYHSDENGPVQIFVAQPDMAGPRCLSPLGQEERFAGLSGAELMLIYNPHQGYSLRPLLGGEAVPIILPPALRHHPGLFRLRLSPSGLRLAAEFNLYENLFGLGQGQLFVLDLDPQNGRTGIYAALGDGSFARWSRDSKALVFIREMLKESHSGTGVWMWEDKGRIQQLSGEDGWNIQADFALGGPGLVWAKAPLYTRDLESGRYDVWLQQTNGRPLRLTQHSAPDLHPSWRPQVGAPLHQEIDFIYDARQYATSRAITVIDHNSPGWLSLESAPGASAGLLLVTEEETLPAGGYQADFRLKITGLASAPATGPLLRLAIANGREILLESLLSGDDLAGDGQYMTFTISFQLEHLTTGLNLRLYTLQDGVRVRCDCISLRAQASAAWYRPLLELWRGWTR
ncbi:MAG: hypothetical protein LBJ14_01530 [Desulfarculales bacterium]|jgi:hypothetical protein|nr:hypothetical protein [Desulfarculales bacterium]